MIIPASKLIKRMTCLRVMPDYEYNPDRNAERIQRRDDQNRLLYRYEVLVVPAIDGRPFQCWMRAAVGEREVAAGDNLVADGLVLTMFSDRDQKLRGSLAATQVSASE